jgi:hypothetical protein
MAKLTILEFSMFTVIQTNMTDSVGPLVSQVVDHQAHHGHSRGPSWRPSRCIQSLLQSHPVQRTVRRTWGYERERGFNGPRWNVIWYNGIRYTTYLYMTYPTLSKYYCTMIWVDLKRWDLAPVYGRGAWWQVMGWNGIYIRAHVRLLVRAYVTGHGNSGKMPVRTHVRDCLIVRLCVRTNVRTYVRINVKIKWQDVYIYILCLSMFVRMVSYVSMWGSLWVTSFLITTPAAASTSIHADFMIITGSPGILAFNDWI